VDALSRRKLVVALGLTTLVIGFDRALQTLAFAPLGDGVPGEPRAIWPGHLYLSANRNSAGFFGLLSDLPAATRPSFFLAATVAFAAFLIVLIARLGPEQREDLWPFSLLIAGVLGNGCDRLVHGTVIDCILFVASPDGFRFWFSVADLAILGGLVWVVAVHIRREAGVARPLGP
jgi:lipoprotein signal peptidase